MFECPTMQALVNNVSSEKKFMNIGVPQRSLLGPLLFILITSFIELLSVLITPLWTNFKLSANYVLQLILFLYYSLIKKINNNGHMQNPCGISEVDITVQLYDENFLYLIN